MKAGLMPIDNKMPEAHFQSQDEIEYTYWWHQHRVNLSCMFLSEWVGKDASILDLGCGTGGFVDQIGLRLHAGSVSGIEVSPAGIDACRKKGVDVQPHDLMKPIELPPAAFDIITIMDVLEHLENEQPVLKNAAMLLRPGGTFLASVPAIPWLYSTWDEQLGHFRRYTKPLLKNIFKDVDLSLVRCTYAFSFALLPSVLRRAFGNKYDSDSCVFPALPPAVNQTLINAGKLEAQWLKRFNIPYGLSLYVMAVRR